jgi:hypothetical protein
VTTFVGEYTNEYERVSDVWKICKSKLVMHWSTGNIDLYQQAAARVKAR